jgi:threonine synthase
LESTSLATGLRCIDCGATHPLGYTLECRACAGLLELTYDTARLVHDGRVLLAGTGLWRYAAVLPIADPSHRVTLGEGGSPLLDCPRLARELGVRRLLVKYEGSGPTGTVKDRSSATAVAAALQFNFRATSVVSSGNAGSSVAAYSARAGLRSLIFAYEKASAPKLLHMAAAATDLVLYAGVYDDLIGLWDDLAEQRLFFDCGASRNPYKHEGKKTIAYEIAEQLDWKPPRWWWRRWRWARPSSPPRAASRRWSRRAGSPAGRAWSPPRRRARTPSRAHGARTDR